MSPTIASLGLDKLTVAERIALAKELWESVLNEHSSVLTDVQKTEFSRWIVEADEYLKFRLS